MKVAKEHIRTASEAHRKAVITKRAIRAAEARAHRDSAFRREVVERDYEEIRRQVDAHVKEVEKLII